jgi:hypothetical protein
VLYRQRRNEKDRLAYHLWMYSPVTGYECDHQDTWWNGRKARIMSVGCARAERRYGGEEEMVENFRHRRSDPLAVKIGRVMSDPAMRARCVGLKIGDSTTADITEGFKVIVTRLEGGELAIEELV